MGLFERHGMTCNNCSADLGELFDTQRETLKAAQMAGWTWAWLYDKQGYDAGSDCRCPGCWCKACGKRDCECPEESSGAQVGREGEQTAPTVAGLDRPA